MKYSLSRRPAPVVMLASAFMLLAACSHDPNRKKLDYFKRSENYFKAGNYQAAEIELRNTIGIDPSFEQAHYLLARTYIKLADIERARHELETTVSLNPNNLNAKLQLAAMLLAGPHHEQAGELAEKALSADPRNVPAHEMLAASYVVKRDLPNAIREFQKALELDPSRLDNYLSLGALYVSSRQPVEAEGVYRRAVAANPQSSQIRAVLSRFYFSSGRMREAESELRAAIVSNPDEVGLKLSLAPIYLATGRKREAEELCAQLKTSAPDNPQAYRALALLYRLTGETEKAAAELRTVSKSKPKDNAVRGLLLQALIDTGHIEEAEALYKEFTPSTGSAILGGRILLAQGKYPQALAEFQKAVTADPKSAPGYYFLGIAQNAAGLPSQAKTSWLHALELQSQMMEAQLSIADAATNNGSHDDALRIADGALKTNPNLLQAHLIRAKVLLAKGDKKEAEALLEMVLDRDPAAVQALALLVHLHAGEKAPPGLAQRISKLLEQHPGNPGLHLLMAKVHFNLKELGNAEASAWQAIAIDRYGSEGHSLLAAIHSAQGLIEKAKSDLQTAIERNPQNIANYLALDRLYEREGNWEQAKKICEKALQLDPGSALVANNLAYLYLEHGGDPNIALTLAQGAKRSMPNSLAAADTLGWAYYKLRLPEPAIVHLKECVQKAPTNSTYQYHLGMA